MLDYPNKSGNDNFVRRVMTKGFALNDEENGWAFHGQADAWPVPPISGKPVALSCVIASAAKQSCSYMKEIASSLRSSR